MPGAPRGRGPAPPPPPGGGARFWRPAAPAPRARPMGRSFLAPRAPGAPAPLPTLGEAGRRCCCCSRSAGGAATRTGPARCARGARGAQRGGFGRAGAPAGSGRLQPVCSDWAAGPAGGSRPGPGSASDAGGEVLHQQTARCAFSAYHAYFFIYAENTHIGCMRKKNTFCVFSIFCVFMEYIVSI